MGPCMLHNPSYDFNDDLIPLGGTLWVRLAEAWLAAPGERPPGRATRRPEAVRPRSQATGLAAHFAQSYAEARDKFFAAARLRGLGVDTHVHPLLGAEGEMLAMDVARDGPKEAQSVLVVSSACHGLFWAGRAGRLARR